MDRFWKGLKRSKNDNKEITKKNEKLSATSSTTITNFDGLVDSYFGELPWEIKRELFKFIESQTLKTSVVFVCREFHKLGKQEWLTRPLLIANTIFEAGPEEACYIVTSPTSIKSDWNLGKQWLLTRGKHKLVKGKHCWQVCMNSIGETPNYYKICVGVITDDHSFTGDEGFLLVNKAFCFIVANGEKCHGRFTATHYAEGGCKNGSILTVKLDLDEHILSFVQDSIDLGKAFDLPKGIGYYPAIFFHGPHEVNVIPRSYTSVV